MFQPYLSPLTGFATLPEFDVELDGMAHDVPLLDFDSSLIIAPLTLEQDIDLVALVASAVGDLLVQSHIHVRYNDEGLGEATSDGHVCGDGCDCDHAHDAKTEYIEMLALLNDALLMGQVSYDLPALVDFAAESLGLDAGQLGAQAIDLLSQKSNDNLISTTVPDIAGDATTTAIITLGTTQTSVTETVGEEDWFAVELVAGQDYIFFQTVDFGIPHSDPLLRLYDAAGVLVAENDDANAVPERGPDGDILLDDAGNPVVNFASRNALIEFTASESGTYYISASGWVDSSPTPVDNSGVGNYTLFAGTADQRADFTAAQQALFLTSGYTGRTTWDSTTVTYAWDSTLPQIARDLFLTAMAAWESVSNIRFEQADVPSQANILFQDTQDGAFANFPSSTRQSVVNVAADWTGSTEDSSYALNTYRYQTYIHEIGHALGLGHSGPYNGNASYARHRFNDNDSWNMSIMSYFDQGEAGSGTARFALAPQLADIIAIQSLYGEVTTARVGDTVYGFNSTENDVFDFSQWVDAGIRVPTLSIFDSAGEDTIDLSGFVSDQRLDLNPESFSDIGDNYNITAENVPLINILSIAPEAWVENAIGGSGNDSLTGNALNNRLEGGAGNDVLIGGAGVDQFVFAATNNGRDTVMDFAIGEDNLIGLDTYFEDFSALSAAMRQVGADTQIDLGNGQAVFLTGIDKDELSADDFAGIDAATTAPLPDLDNLPTEDYAGIIYDYTIY
jgi:Ca2+-binding RTX toxin-like protein